MLGNILFLGDDYLINVVKGFIIGIGKIMPGVSGAVLAMNLGVYEEAIYCISNFFKKPWQSIKYLLPIVIGIIAAIVVMSKTLIYFLNTYYLPTMLLFIGLIIGSFNSFIKKLELKKAHKYDYMVMLMSFALVFIMDRVKGNVNFDSYCLIGIVDAVTMIVPGLCGSVFMMLLGIYDNYLDLLSNIANMSYLNHVMLYGVSLCVTIIIISKVIAYFFNTSKHIYFAIFGFSTASLMSLFFETLQFDYTTWEIIIAYLFLLIGYYIGNVFDN